MSADALLTLLHTPARAAAVQAVELLLAADDAQLTAEVVHRFPHSEDEWTRRVSLFLLGSVASGSLGMPRQVTVQLEDRGPLWWLTAPHLRLFSLKLCGDGRSEVVLPDCPAVRSLVTLHVRGIQRLTLAPSMPSLRTLNLTRCMNLRQLDGLERAPRLENLLARQCASLERLQDISTLKALCRLDVRGSPNLQQVDGLEHHPGLKVLHLVRTPLCVRSLPRITQLTLSDIPRQPTPAFRHLESRMFRAGAFAGFPSLQKLVIRGSDVASLEGLPTGLTHLVLRNTYIGSFRGLAALPPLQHLTISARMFGGRSLAGLEGQENLRHLELRHSAGLNDITAISGLPLVSLRLTTLRALRSLAPLQTLTALRSLDLRWLQGSGRPDTQRPDGGICQLTTLQHLHLHRCGWLGSLSDIARLTDLQTLSVHGCRNLQRWGDLRSLPLQRLDTRRCFWAGEHARVATGPDAAVLAEVLQRGELARQLDVRHISQWTRRTDEQKARCTRMHLVGLQGEPALPRLTAARRLQELSIQSVRRSSQWWQWSAMGPVESLRRLILRGCLGVVLDGVDAFAPGLQELDLIGVVPESLRPLQQCQHLDTLRILHRWTDARSGLSALANLTHLGLLGRSEALSDGIWPQGVDTLEIVHPAQAPLQQPIRCGAQVRHLLLAGSGTLQTLDPIQHMGRLESVTLRKSNIRCAAAIAQHATLQRADLRDSRLPAPLRRLWEGPAELAALRALL